MKIRHFELDCTPSTRPAAVIVQRPLNKRSAYRAARLPRGALDASWGLTLCGAIFFKNTCKLVNLINRNRFNSLRPRVAPSASKSINAALLRVNAFPRTVCSPVGTDSCSCTVTDDTPDQGKARRRCKRRASAGLSSRARSLFFLHCPCFCYRYRALETSCSCNEHRRATNAC